MAAPVLIPIYSMGSWGRVIALREDSSEAIAIERPTGQITTEQGRVIAFNPAAEMTPQETADGWQCPIPPVTSVALFREVEVVHPRWAAWQAAGLITAELLADVPEPWNAAQAQAAAKAILLEQWRAAEARGITVSVGDTSLTVPAAKTDVIGYKVDAAAAASNPEGTTFVALVSGEMLSLPNADFLAAAATFQTVFAQWLATWTTALAAIEDATSQAAIDEAVAAAVFPSSVALEAAT